MQNDCAQCSGGVGCTRGFNNEEGPLNKIGTGSEVGPQSPELWCVWPQTGVGTQVLPSLGFLALWTLQS